MRNNTFLGKKNYLRAWHFTTKLSSVKMNSWQFALFNKKRARFLGFFYISAAEVLISIHGWGGGKEGSEFLWETIKMGHNYISQRVQPNKEEAIPTHTHILTHTHTYTHVRTCAGHHPPTNTKNNQPSVINTRVSSLQVSHCSKWVFWLDKCSSEQGLLRSSKWLSFSLLCVDVIVFNIRLMKIFLGDSVADAFSASCRCFNMLILYLIREILNGQNESNMSLSVHVFVYCLMCPLKAFLIEDRQLLKNQYDSKNVSSVILTKQTLAHFMYTLSIGSVLFY